MAQRPCRAEYIGGVSRHADSGEDPIFIRYFPYINNAFPFRWYDVVRWLHSWSNGDHHRQAIFTVMTAGSRGLVSSLPNGEFVLTGFF